MSTGVAQTIGRYFSVISVIPSSLYVVFVYLLISSGSWHHSPDWSHAFTSLQHISIGGIGALAFLGIGLGLAIHPIQFSLVQFLEGYWGTTGVAQSIRSWRILHYRQFCLQLSSDRIDATKQLLMVPKAGADVSATRVRLISAHSEADRIRDNFPGRIDDIMPTRLGNVLRRYESQAGRQYGMDALQVVPHLLSIAPESHTDYVSDQRSQLDLAVRMTFVSIAACVTAIIFLWPYGYWILVSAIPYFVAYLSYRGSIIAAGHYGSAFDALINLNRFALYEQLHLPIPTDTASERLVNKKMDQLFHYVDFVVIKYQHPNPGSGTGDAPKLNPAACGCR